MELKTITYLSNLLHICIDKKIYSSGKIMHAYILRNKLNENTFISNRLMEFYVKSGCIISARNMFDQIKHKNIYSWQCMLDYYCKSGNMEKTVEFFEKMDEKSVLSWNMVISGLVRNGLEKMALSVYSKMYLEGFMATRFTLASVLSGCGELGDVKYGSKLHGVSVKSGLDKNIFVGNALLSMYAKSRCLNDAIRVFENLVEPNEVSFTAMMGALAESYRVEEAFSTFRLMRMLGLCIDSVLLSSVLTVCASVVSEDFSVTTQARGILSDNILGWQIHGLTVKLGFERDLHLSNSLLDMYVKSGDMVSAELVFSDIPQVSVVSWNIMIGGYGQRNRFHLALAYMERMLYEGFQPNEVTYVNMLTACIRSGEVDIARRIFNNMSCPSVSSWNAILSGYLQIENHKEVIELFRKMQFQSVRPDTTTLSLVLSSCTALGSLQAGKQIHAASCRLMFDSDVYIASGIIGMYSKCNNVVIAKRIFDRIPERDMVCWNALIAGLYVVSLAKEAFNLFKKMLTENIYPSQFSYATALSCCAKLSSLSRGRQLHAQVTKHGFANDIFVGSSLVDMYCKCGDVEGARKYFDTIPFKNTITWNGMILGYAQNGFGAEALSLYEYMLAMGEEPDGITFVAVLTACSHSGVVDPGIRIFNSMELDYGIKPQIDHYTCIIDALSRADRFNEAEVILDKMPYKDNPIVWEVVLSSCRVHGNVRLAERAAKILLRLDPKNSTPYVLLANIYSSEGRWEEVKTIREMMNDKNIVKDRGYSFVENINDSSKSDDGMMVV